MSSQTAVIAFVGLKDSDLDSVFCFSITEAEMIAAIMSGKRVTRQIIKRSFLLVLEED